MNLDLIQNIINGARDNKLVQNFIKELQNYLEKNNSNTKGEGIHLMDINLNSNKLITKYRDKMLTARNDILNNYAKQTLDKGEMYYIYSKNSNLQNTYNLCVCEEGQSHIVIEANRNELPEGIEVGSVLRKLGENYILDDEATETIREQINEMQDQLIEEQAEFLESRRIEGHIYEMSEKTSDRAFLFDITDSSVSDEEIEEIDFPIELLQDASEGDMFKYINGNYEKYINN